ncbi:MAG: hydroxymyristoyl-ACP dehydratase [Rikenellaceae bacterium]|nr:hydroxymyristoyl-ACP dehydratase [Rikenellaceae bacterium]
MGVFEKAVARGSEILEYIPQRAPMVMVDTFYGVYGDVSVSSLEVTPENIFVRDGIMEECGIVEHVAQSAALRAGFLYRSRGERVPLGFIASVSKVKVYRCPKVGETITTRVTVIQEVMDITLLAAESTVGDEKCCGCSLKIYLKPENET